MTTERDRETYVTIIQPTGDNGSDELEAISLANAKKLENPVTYELRAVSILASVSHREDAGSGMFQLAIFHGVSL